MKNSEVKLSLLSGELQTEALKIKPPDNLLISPNKKLGNISHISTLPLSDCPGKSSWCQDNCYTLSFAKSKLAKDTINLSKKYVKQAYTSHLSKHNIPKLYKLLLRTLFYSNTRVIRLFVEGDWSSAEQIETFRKAIAQFPDIMFFFFTRS